MLSKNVLVIIFFLIVEAAIGQSVHKGIVLDSLSREPVPFATITLTNTDDSVIVAFAVSGYDGKFDIEKIISDKLILNVSSMGFASKSYPESQSYWDLIDTIELTRADYDLASIEVKAYKNGIIINGDTTVYEVESFSNGRENNFEDVLKKMPGISVDEDGEIKVGGKVVKELLVEGDDFMDSNRKNLIQSLKAEDIDAVEVIHNYKGENDPDILNIGEKQIAINLKLSPSSKNEHKGELEAGGGIINKFDVHGAGYKLNGKFKYFANTDFENTGRKNFKVSDYFRITRPQDRSKFKPASQGTDVPSFFLNKDKNSTVNTRYIGSNISYKASDRLRVKGYVFGLSSANQISEEAKEQSIAQPFVNSSNTTLSSGLNHLSTHLQLHGTPSEQIYWNASTIFSAETANRKSKNDRDINGFQFLDDYQSKELNTNFSSDLQLKYYVDSSKVLEAQVAIDLANKNDDINLGTNEEQIYLLDATSIAGDAFKQEIGRDRISVDGFLGYGKYFALFKYYLRLGVQRESISLSNEGIQVTEEQFFQNNLQVIRNYLWSDGEVEYSKNNLSIGIGLRGVRSNLIMDNNLKFFFQPTAEASLDIPRFTQRINLRYNKSIKPIELPEGYGGHLIQSLGRISIFDINPGSRTQSNNIQLNYRIFDYYSSTLFFMIINYSIRQEIREDLFYTNTYELRRAVMGQNENSSFLIAILDKKIHRQKLGTRVDFISVQNEYFTSVSKIPQIVEGKSFRLKTNFYTIRKEGFNIESGLGYQRDRFGISDNGRKIDIWSNNLKILSPSGKNIKWEIGSELYFENQIERKNYYQNLYASIEYNLTKKNNFFVRVAGNDLLNINQASRITLTQNANNLRSVLYNTLSGYIILSLKYKL